MVIELNQENFENEVVKNKGPVIVDFWAEWCMPCKAIAPIFEKLSLGYKKRLRFAKVNVSQNQGLAEKYEVRAIPCLIIFNKGKEEERIIGSMQEGELKGKIDEILSKLK